MASFHLLSPAEKTFIIHGVQDDLRSDGRRCEEYRHIELESDVVSNANGSARIKLANTDVLISVKAEMGEPSPESPNEGKLEFFVDCSANATPEFEGRGGEDLALEISNTLHRAINTPCCSDLKSSLCIIPGKQCWILYVDILILQYGGNLLDASSMGVKAALFNTKLPRIKVTTIEGGIQELELTEDPYDNQRLCVDKVPCIVTLNKIGHRHVVDASEQEESCILASMHMSVTEVGKVTSMLKGGSGSLDPESIYEMMQSGKRVGQIVNKILLEKLKEEASLGSKKQKVGLLR